MMEAAIKITLGVLYMILVAAALAACSPQYSGHLRTNGDDLVLVDKKGRKVYFQPGQVEIKVEKRGQFFDKTLLVKGDKKKVKIQVPKRAYLSAFDFTVDADESGQLYDIQGDYRHEITSQRTRYGSRSCTHYAYCHGCDYDYFDEEWDCGYAFRFNCPGVQNVEYTDTTHSEYFDLHFLEPGSGREVAKFKSYPNTHTDTYISDVLGDCN
jgi:hypothetical protein